MHKTWGFYFDEFTRAKSATRAQQSWSRKGAVHLSACTARVTAAALRVTTLGREAPGSVTGFAEGFPRGLINRLSVFFPQNCPFPSLAWSEIIKSTGSFFLLHFLRRGFRKENSRIWIYHLTSRQLKSIFCQIPGSPGRVATAGPISHGGGGLVAARRLPDPERGSRPSDAGPRGPREGGPASAAPGAARDRQGYWGAAPTWARAGTCGRGGARPGICQPRSFPRLPPPNLWAVLQRLLDGQLVDPRHRGKRRAAARDEAAAHSSPHPPACSSWPRPALSRWLHRPRRAPSGRAMAREIPPRRPACSASLPAHWLTTTPVSAAGLARRFLRCSRLRWDAGTWRRRRRLRRPSLRTSTPTLRERLAINRRGPSYLSKACVSWNQSFEWGPFWGNWGCFTSPSTFFVRDHERGLSAGAFSFQRL